jgi:hypothetical protein
MSAIRQYDTFSPFWYKAYPIPHKKQTFPHLGLKSDGYAGNYKYLQRNTAMTTVHRLVN